MRALYDLTIFHKDTREGHKGCDKAIELVKRALYALVENEVIEDYDIEYDHYTSESLNEGEEDE